jgi:hypothetical protein
LLPLCYFCFFAFARSFLKNKFCFLTFAPRGPSTRAAEGRTCYAEEGKGIKNKKLLPRREEAEEVAFLKGRRQGIKKQKYWRARDKQKNQNEGRARGRRARGAEVTVKVY